jgi:hypothetical protein
MIFGSGPPIWIVLLFLAMLVIFPVLSGIGINFLISKKFSKFALLVSAAIYLSIVILTLADSSASLSFTLMLLGMPFTLGSLFFSASDASLLFFAIIGLVLNYFVIFGAVNFIHRKFSRAYL